MLYFQLLLFASLLSPQDVLLFQSAHLLPQHSVVLLLVHIKLCCLLGPGKFLYDCLVTLFCHAPILSVSLYYHSTPVLLARLHCLQLLILFLLLLGNIFVLLLGFLHPGRIVCFESIPLGLGHIPPFLFEGQMPRIKSIGHLTHVLPLIVGARAYLLIYSFEAAQSHAMLLIFNPQSEASYLFLAFSRAH